MKTRRAHLFGAVLLAVESWPLLAGAVSAPWFWPLFAGASLVTVHALRTGSERAWRATLVTVSVAFTLGLSDLALRYRPLVPPSLVEQWPRLPLVRRYTPDLDFEGLRFNDLSRMAGVRRWREDKRVRVVTDAAGFRNERPEPGRPFDVVLVGDSFGAGAVTQTDTWTAMLSRDYGLAAYNLSASGAGPWHEYVNFWAEKDRLATRKGALLLWQLFTGNDLDDEYGSLDMAALPWRGPVGTWLNRIDQMRARSPVRALFARPSEQDLVVDRPFPNGRTLLFFKPYIAASGRSLRDVLSHPSYPRLRETVLAMKTLAASRDMRLAVVLVPAKEEVYAWAWKGSPPWTTEPATSGFAAAVAALCVEAGLPFLDTGPHLVRESRRLYERSGRILYWYDDTHMNADGNRVVVPLVHRELLAAAYNPRP